MWVSGVQWVNYRREMQNESPERQIKRESQSDAVPNMSPVICWIVLVAGVTTRGRCGPAITLIIHMKASAPSVFLCV